MLPIVAKTCSSTLEISYLIKHEPVKRGDGCLIVAHKASDSSAILARVNWRTVTIRQRETKLGVQQAKHLVHLDGEGGNKAKTDCQKKNLRRRKATGIFILIKRRFAT
ncbi:MAG: hypothetical protein P4N59_10085 [Negativicutes bacterium]|nr:hypothetical protein [Negativicutes bacterium]